MNKFLVLILCKQRSEKINDLENIFSNHNIHFLTVCDLCTADIDNSLLKLGFFDLTRSPYIKKPSSWDKAFYKIYADNLSLIYDYFFFIEDDVYSEKYETLINFIIDCANNFDHDLITKQIRPRSHYPSWKHWKEEYTNLFLFPSQSFNPICRLSKVLISKILQYREKNKKFNFHEIIIPSLCLEHKLSYINYIEIELLKKYIGSIRYNPIITKNMLSNNLIYHPVKDCVDDREKSIVPLDSGR